MSCKLLSGCCFTEKIATWFLCYCLSIPRTLSHQVLLQYSCYPVVHCCSNWQARCHSCITPTRQAVSAGEHMCVCVVYATLSVFYLTCMSVHAHKTQMLCSYSVSLCKHVLAKHAVTLDLTQTQSSVQKSLTAALNYINYHRQKTHTLCSHWLQP